MDPRETSPIRTILTTATCILALAACNQSSPPVVRAPDTAAKSAPIAAAPDKAAGEKTAETPKPDPDAALAARVKAAFDNDADLKMLPIDVRSTGGAVTLYGTADNNRLKNKAAQVASKVEGVTSVSNNLQIVKGS